MVEGIRARNRAAIEAEILRLGREHLARYGAPALSLRAIARELGMSSSAVYRYVESRDELLTRLIVAAYTSLGDDVEQALAELGGTADPATQFARIARSTRAWAVTHPHEYALIYGSPVPQYHAPAERTTPAGTRVQVLLIGLLARIEDQPSGTAVDDRALGSMLDAPELAQVAGAPITTGGLRRGLGAWSLVMGAISAEVFGQYGDDTIADPEALFDGLVELASGLLPGAGR